MLTSVNTEELIENVKKIVGFICNVSEIVNGFVLGIKINSQTAHWPANWDRAVPFRATDAVVLISTYYWTRLQSERIKMLYR